MAAILGAVLVIFENSTSLMLLLCYALYQLLPEYIEEKKRFLKIYNHLKAMAASLDAILKIIAFSMWDFGGTISMLFMISNTTQIRWKTFV